MADPTDPKEMERRIASLLPPWFGVVPGEAPPVLATVLAMPVRLAIWLHGLATYARKQTRIRTASGAWLDLIAYDFFGQRVRRRRLQPDESFRSKIQTEMFRPRATREALRRLMVDMTGREPDIFEPLRPADTGGVGIAASMGVGVRGRLGTLRRRGQVLLSVYRTPEAGIPGVGGVGRLGKMGVGAVGSRAAVAALSQVEGGLRNEDIIAAVRAVKPAGIVVWMQIQA